MNQRYQCSPTKGNRALQIKGWSVTVSVLCLLPCIQQTTTNAMHPADHHHKCNASSRPPQMQCIQQTTTNAMHSADHHKY
eukprot:1138179-Pelagomonas_calceolata.AAC.1